MTNSPLWWLIFNLISIAVLSFFSMLEMACVSFNRLRLQYYVSKGMKRAIWLNFLLKHSAYLFGTTLIGVNVALIVGSECSRKFYASIGLSPDLAPLTQVFLVVIFGELAPMFAARRYAEHVALLGAPLVYACAKIMTPLLFCISYLSKVLTKFFGGKEPSGDLFPSREELQKILEEMEERPGYVESDDFNLTVSRIFNLRGKDAKMLMDPFDNDILFPSNATVQHVREVMTRRPLPYILVYQREKSNIVGVAYPRNLIRAADARRVRDFAGSPWFVGQHSDIFQILKQFRRNNENAAIILDDKGRGIGMLTLDDIVEEIFGKVEYDKAKKLPEPQFMVAERTLQGSMKVRDFKEQYGVQFDDHGTGTLSQLMEQMLGHHPEEGEMVYLGSYELIVKDASLVDVKSILLRTRLK